MNKKFFSWLIEKKWWTILSFFLLAGIIILIVRRTDHEAWWNGWVEIPVVLGTFIFSLLVFALTSYKEWDNELPKRLTVHFVLRRQNDPSNDKYLMTCHEALLIDINDIRAWAQQIGTQLTLKPNNRLDFLLEFKIDPNPERVNYAYNLYTMTYYLTSIPASREYDGSDTSPLNSKYRVWVMTEDNGRPDKKCDDFKGHPDAPMSKEDFLNHYHSKMQKNAELQNKQG